VPQSVPNLADGLRVLRCAHLACAAGRVQRRPTANSRPE
jgi:hypothetical protein